VPFILVRLGPFAILLAAMWTIQRMVRDNEVVAAQVAGVSMHRLMAPILLGGVVLSLGLWGIRQHLLPRLAVPSHEYEVLMRGRTEVLLDGPIPVKDSRGNNFSFQAYDPVTTTARGVQIRVANASKILDYPAIQFDHARRTWAVISAGGESTTPLPLETDLLPQDIEVDRGIKFLVSDEIEDLVRKLPGHYDLELMLQTRFTCPFATVVLLLLGIPLVVKRERQSVYAAWGLCMLLSILYFGTENVLHGLSERDKVLAPVVAAWLPIAVFGI